MKEYFFESYGGPEMLQLREVDKPVPAEDGAVVRVNAASINPYNLYAMKGLYISRLQSGLFRPKRTQLSANFSGVVDSVGPNFQGFRPGDEVYGSGPASFAAYAPFGHFMVKKPVNISFEQAAAIPTAAATAIQGLRDQGQLRPGDQVLINGASGGVGTFAIQIAKALGGVVTAVCSTQNVKQAEALRADTVIDYTKEDFTQGGERYDVLLDIAGSHTWAEYRRVLKGDARFVIVGGHSSNKIIGPMASALRLQLAARGDSQQVKFFMADYQTQDFEWLNPLIEEGKVTPIVDRTYPFAELPEAMQYLADGHARGKVVVSMSQ